MSDLEDILRDRAKKGELNYISIACTERGFEVAYKGITRDGTLTVHYDPVCAVLKALTGKPGVEPPRAQQGTKRRRTPSPVTATASPATPATDEFADLLG